MALGTPVAAAAAYSANNGTSVSPAYPSGILATDAVLLFVGQKPSTANSGTVTTPTGWTLRDSLTAAGGYGTTLGADTGNTNLFVYTWDTPVAGQTGSLSVTLGTNNVTWAFIVRIPSGGGAPSYGSADGQRTTTPTSPMSIALTNGATATDFQSGDIAIWAMCIPTDVTTPSQFSAQSITATGATFGTATELNEPDSTTGNDIGGYSAWAEVTAGTSTTAPTVTVTLAGTLTNVRGPVVLLRVRELPFIDAASTTFSITGQNTTDTITRAINAEAGSFTYTGEDATLTKTAAPKEINAAAGSFSYTGQDATFVYNPVKQIDAAAASFSISGQNATLSKNSALNAESGSFTYTGQAADLTYTSAGRSLDAAAGSFSIAGQNAEFLRSYAFNAESGAYGEADPYVDSGYVDPYYATNLSAALGYGRVFNASAGVFSYTGQDATLYQAYLYPLESDVRAGVHYGPGGMYVGTLTAENGEMIIRLRSFTERC